MTIDLCLLDPNTEEAYSDLLRHARGAMLNHSLTYRDFLKKVLIDADHRYILAYEDGRLVGAIPTFTKYGDLGYVVNSLPFFGSHGGLITHPGASAQVGPSLIAAVYDHCKAINALCSTIIESPFTTQTIADEDYGDNFVDFRIGQVNNLPRTQDQESVVEALFRQFPQKTRNLVRKGLKGGFEVDTLPSEKALRALWSLHVSNMDAIGGVAKPWKVFEAIRDTFEPEKEYRIYTASIEGQIVSALLLFYFKDIVEYFTPATHLAYRSREPLRLLIFHAMKDAVAEKGMKRWNWGGTWLTQDGVYHFKSSWGAVDHRYRYHIRLYSNILHERSVSRTQLLDQYPFFYTVPFSILKG